MKIIIRTFFKFVRIVLGPVMLLKEKLTRPQGIARTQAAQGHPHQPGNEGTPAGRQEATCLPEARAVTPPRGILAFAQASLGIIVLPGELT